VQMPLTLIKNEKNHYVLRSCLSDRSSITIKFPISKKAYNTVADSDIGHIKIMDEHIEWIIKNEQFKEAEIKYDFDLLMSDNEKLGPIQISFTSKFFSLSELIIKDVRDSDNVKKEAWVSYMVEAQDYEVRG
ncbi:Adaptor complexes medium subunit family, partial [Trachipleistophora hominis]